MTIQIIICVAICHQDAERSLSILITPLVLIYKMVYQLRLINRIVAADNVGDLM
jgi:hypothetical protein